MKRHGPISERLSDRAEQGGSAEARAGVLVRKMGSPQRLGGEAHARILGRLRASEAGSGFRFWAIPRPALVALLALAVALPAIGASGRFSRLYQDGVTFLRELGSSPRENARARPALGSDSKKVASPRSESAGPKPVGEMPSTPVSGAETPGLGEVASERASGVPVTNGAAETTSKAGSRSERAPLQNATNEPERGAPEASPIAQESRLLALALQQIRTRRDYSGALATLAEYEQRFPAGALRGEAALARLDAWMGLGNSAAALQLLDRMDIRGPRSLEIFVMRGELRASAQRCREAIGDFDRALSGGPPPRLVERALYGRASCRSRSGDVAGSRRDLAEYLSRFPNGARATEVRRKLSP